MFKPLQFVIASVVLSSHAPNPEKVSVPLKPFRSMIELAASVSTPTVSLNEPFIDKVPPPSVTEAELLIELPAVTRSEPPVFTTTEEVSPMALALAALRVPALTTVAPEWEFDPLRTRVPTPFLVIPPVPLMPPEIVVVPLAFIIGAMETDVPYRVHGNVLNRGLIPNLPSNACVEVPCMVDRNGINPCHVGDLPEICAAMNRTNINPQLLAIEAAVTRKKEAVYQAAMLDPHTAAELSLDDIRALCDDLFEAHAAFLPDYT